MLASVTAVNREVNDGAWTPRFQHLGSPTVKLNSPIATLNALIVVGNPLACAEALGSTSGSELRLGDLRKI